MVYCTQCHRYVAAGATQCPSCGQAIVVAATGVTQRLQPPASPTCLRCGSAMEKGFILDSQGSWGDTLEQWVEGAPKRTFWYGDIDTSGQRVLPVRTYRCVGCGYLESYALPDEQSEA